MSVTEVQALMLIVQTLILIIILAILVWKKKWQWLLFISFLAASSGYLALNIYLAGDIMGTTLAGCSSYTETGAIRCMQSHISMLELVVISFLKAIFVLILAIFAWLQSEAEKKD